MPSASARQTATAPQEQAEQNSKEQPLRPFPGIHGCRKEAIDRVANGDEEVTDGHDGKCGLLIGAGRIAGWFWAETVLVDEIFS